MSPEFYLSVFTAFSVFVLGFLQWRSDAKKKEADAQSSSKSTEAGAMENLSNAYKELVDSQAARIESLETRVDELEKKLRTYVNWSARLVKQLADHGIVPVPIDTGPLGEKKL
jgi:cell division protein FtsB